MTTSTFDALFPRSDAFADRHLGPRRKDLPRMLETLGLRSLDDLVAKALPAAIRWHGELAVPAAAGEHEAIAELRALADKNEVWRSYLGMGYHGTLTPPVILRNVLENPGWYTQYTPYQAEISQGRLEALLNYQTLILELTGLDCTNASLLDEGTAAAEAMTMFHRALGAKAEGRSVFLVSDDCHPQTVDVVRMRAEPLGFEVRTGDPRTWNVGSEVFGCLVQWPGSSGRIDELAPIAERVHAAGALLAVAADPLALVLLEAPGRLGADAVVGCMQRYGVPMGYGGPHAGYLATKDTYKRTMPGRIIGVTRDARGGRALRMALQTREQHIRREKATSNICTAQVLLAVMASTYAVWHGPEGLRGIANRVRGATGMLAGALTQLGCKLGNDVYFDTLRVRPGRGDARSVLAAAAKLRINLREFGDGSLGIALDETVTERDLRDLVSCFGGDGSKLDLAALARQVPPLPAHAARKGAILTHPTFNSYHAEHELLRYLHRLQSKDLSLTTSMIPLGSCTMKLNATAEMIPVTFGGFGNLHPFVPAAQAQGYAELNRNLAAWLASITGFAGCSLQPNAGSQGEYAGLLVIRAWHRSRGQEQRSVCLIPSSAHGTNPASAVMAGMSVVVVRCDERGNIDVDDLKSKAAEHRNELAALMVTYPSTHGVFESAIKDICKVVHEHGGQVYLDGANMNAQVGLCRPGDLGADVCHLNLHKTFCIPHGGGGPGMGPICVAPHLVPFLPGHPVVKTGGSSAIGAVSAAPFGSASILPISYAYIRMMGPRGLAEATQIAILNANYVAERLRGHYEVLYRGEQGLVAHECILDCRGFEKSAHVTVADIAKRLMDYGFHAPTMSFPVAGTLMVEPTESESKEELDRFCDALIAIRDEIRAIERGELTRDESALAHAPHTMADVMQPEWSRRYTREQAAFPAPWLRAHKYWPTVSRVDDVYGDRNLVCTCPPVESYA
ncbi:MAG: aminomethyl-transferring glycine dehydrogenase [Planctomycetes bacterium]|nr:aminomethyl-transferring glycine dehydrogenase [Planctomycetota bacterium]